MDNIIDASTFLKNKKSSTEPPKRIMIIQLGYVKDIIMMTPFLQELREKEKNATIEILVLEELREIIEGADFVDIVNIISNRIVDRMNEMLLDKIDDFFNEPFSYNFINSLGDFDSVYNFTDGPFASWICENLYSEEKEGAVLINDGEFLYRGSWSTYVGGIPLFRDMNRFNYTDMYRGFLGENTSEKFKKLYVAKHICNIMPEKKMPMIAISLVEPIRVAKKWKAEYFFKLCGLLVEKGYQVVLLGDESDKKDTDKIIKEYGDRVIDLTSVSLNSEKAWIMSKCEAVLVNSPNDAFIGAASDVPVVCIYTNEDLYELVPYSDKALVLYLNKANFMTATKFYHKIAANAVEYLLGKISMEEFKDLDKEVFFKAYKTEFIDKSIDGFGGVRIRDISGKVEINAQNIFAELLRFSIAIGRSQKEYDNQTYNLIEEFLSERFIYDFDGLGELLKSSEEFYKSIKWLEMDYRKLINSLKRRSKKSGAILRKIRGEEDKEKDTMTNPEEIGIEIARKEELLDSLNMNRQYIRPLIGPMLWETRMILSIGEDFMKEAIAIYEKYSEILNIQIDLIKFIMEKYGINGTEKKRKTKRDIN